MKWLLFIGILSFCFLIFGCVQTKSPQTATTQGWATITVNCPDLTEFYDYSNTPNGHLTINSIKGYCDFQNQGTAEGTGCISVQMMAGMPGSVSMGVIAEKEICRTLKPNEKVTEQYYIVNPIPTQEYGQIGIDCEGKGDAHCNFQ